MKLIRVKILKNECLENVSAVIPLTNLSYNCPKGKKESEHARPSNSEVETCSVITQKELHLKDEDRFSLTWHVVPTKHLNFEAIIDTDILEQASLNFTEEGVEFHKYVGKKLSRSERKHSP
ncbi:hypothetical protein NPIL_71481 [Nephila pilipes]|uniref:Uncharacterized protein n=1 Tax=Nephila pilipes TaxID=299642 RepID=A0A8X6PE55_NEPPI|nr:hypothetical protein NPIL_71481 [Nephila pilipes]